MTSKPCCGFVAPSGITSRRCSRLMNRAGTRGMPSRLVNLRGEPLFDIASYGRRGPGRRDHLSTGDIDRIARTVRRAPEVMIKVLSRGDQDLKAVRRHLD